MTYGSETGPLLADVGLRFERAEMPMVTRKTWSENVEGDMVQN